MPYPDEVPLLTDGVVTLRAYRNDDAAAIVAFAGDERSQRWIPLPVPYGDQQAREFLDQCARQWSAAPVHPNWAIEVDGRYAGGINCRRVQPGTWELGYSAVPDARGRGTVSRAAALVRDFVFDELDATTLTWRAARGNFASRRVAWNIGITVDGSWPNTHRGTIGPVDDTWMGHLHRSDRDRERRAWWEPAVLTGEHVVLRPWTEADRPEQGPDDWSKTVAPDMQPSPESFDEWLLTSRERMAEGGWVGWAIADRATDEVLGHIQVTRLHIDFIKGTGSVGYWLYPSARGRGVAQEALDLLIPHAFAPRTDLGGRAGLGLRRLEAGIDSRNRASRRTLLRAGFRFWGAEREVLAYGGETGFDAESFELLATDDRQAQRVQPLAVPTLETERFVLREWTADDAPQDHHVTDDDARRFMSNELPTAATFPASLRRREQGADRGESISWCITDRASGEVLGNIGYFAIGEGITAGAEVGYWLWKSSRGRGTIGEVLPVVLDHGFDTLGLTRIQAETDLDNIASQRILLKAGFAMWGTDHQAYTNADGSITDGAYFELFAGDRERRPELPTAPVVRGEGVRLRPLRMSDAERVHEASTDPAFALWLNSDTGRAYDQTRAWLAREVAPTDDRTRWAVTESSDDTFIGCVTLQNIDRTVAGAEVGYWMHPDARGRGLATAAVRTLATHALSPQGARMRRLSLNVADGNDASVRVAQRAGFTRSGVDRLAEALGDGRVVDLLRFERLAHE